MELLVFGHAGFPMLVFPTSMGRFYEYEDRGMVSTLVQKLDAGTLRLYCVDSVDAETWYRKAAPVPERLHRHNQYEAYLLQEVAPLMGTGRIGVTGCSFGGFHAVNFALRHPDLVAVCVSMGGAFDHSSLLGGYSDTEVYYHQPLAYLPNLNDGWYWERYQQMRLVLATGENDMCKDDNLRLAHVLGTKSIPHQLDVWGDGTGHDWQWWQQMALRFF
jgi:esterase/lipase superfamily enzyme